MRDLFSVSGVTLILGDAREGAARPEWSGRAGLILTDPPYLLTSGGKPKWGPARSTGRGHKIMSGMFDPSIYSNDGVLMAAPSWPEIAQTIRLLAGPDCDALVFANDKNIFPAHASLTAEGFKTHNLLVWDKRAATPNRWYMKRTEFIAYMWRGKARAITHKGDGQIFTESAPRGTDKLHPTEKPVSILRRLIANSARDGLAVVDPFAGSASTLLAAALEDREAFGFEICPDHFERAAGRLERVLGRVWV